MPYHKRIEECIARYIANRYARVVEVGIGRNMDVARRLMEAGVHVRCTDIALPEGHSVIELIEDDIFEPREEIYRGAELIYAVRPGVELVPPLIAISSLVDADLIVYHLGNEIFEDGGTIIDCGVTLHLYRSRASS
ncbi:MAG: UPF0146 family protein [Methanomicrobiales archaeon]|nr:UPF0146 family protein [Methanomicrobiales archaeon]